MTSDQTFGFWLKARRRALDLTQEQLGKQVFCAEITVRKIEADQLRPSRELAELLIERVAYPDEDRFVLMGWARGRTPEPAAPGWLVRLLPRTS